MEQKIQLSDHFGYKRLIRFTVPSILMMIVTSIYSVVDGFFISNFVGKTPFAAVNFIMPFLMIVGVLGFMFGAGGSALIAKTMGEGRKEKANEIFSLLTYATLISGGVIAVVGFVFIRPIAIFLGAEGALLAYGGVEGEDYRFSANGKWIFMTNSLRDINTIRAEVLMYTGVAMPALYPAEFIFRVDSALDQHVFSASEKVREFSELVTPAYALSAADQEKANALSAKLGGMVDRGIARFATGEIKMTDENYEAWLEELREAGSGELTALFQQAMK